MPLLFTPQCVGGKDWCGPLAILGYDRERAPEVTGSIPCESDLRGGMRDCMATAPGSAAQRSPVYSAFLIFLSL